VKPGQGGRRRRFRARGSESGFTLVELVVTISIMGIVAVALGAAFVVSAHDSIGISDRFGESQDAQIASANLATDVQSNAALATPSCTSGSPVIGFGYDDGTVASYCYGSGVLTREYSGSPAQSQALVKNGSAAPTLACVNPSGCAVGSKPTKVTITINETHGYNYSLSGSRRPYINGGANVPPPPAPYGLLAFSNGTVTLQGNNSFLTVHGPMIVDSTNPSSAVSIGGSGNSRRLSVYADSTETSPGYFGIRQGGGCSTCTSTNSYPYPWSSYTTSITDPFAGLAYPDEAPFRAAVPPQVYADGKNHGPGVYTATLNLSSDTTLASGVYILEAGMSVSNGNLDANSGVLLFNGCGLNSPTCAAGTGSMPVSFTGQSVVNITPLQTGPYQLLAIWQPAANTQPMTMAGRTSTSVLRGIVYAPGSTGLSIGSGSGNGTVQIWSVAGTAIALSGNGRAIVGQ